MAVRRRIVLIPLLALAVMLTAGVVVFYGFIPATITLARPTNTENAALDGGIILQFNKPVLRRPIVPSISPDIEGEWRFEQPLLGTDHLFRSVRFVPDRVLEPETEYTVTFDGVSNLLRMGKPRQFTASFTTRSLPDVANVVPEDKTKGLSPDTPVTVKLTQPNPANLAEFEFQFKPAIAVDVQLDDANQTYTLTPKKSWKQGTQYRLTIERTFVVRDQRDRSVIATSEPKRAYRGTFRIAPPPKAVDVSPTEDDTFVDRPAVVAFSDPMQPASVREHFSVEPDVPGDLVFTVGDTTLTFTPRSAWAYDTSYAVRVAKGAENAIGGSLTDDILFSFTTIGPLHVDHVSPSDSANGVAQNTTIRLDLNQESDHASAEAAFRLEPGVTGTFTWDDTTLVFHPSQPLALGTTYTVVLTAGVDSIHGQDSQAEFRSSFTTVQPSVRLDVAIDLQDRALSCEAAALKMALAGKGVFVSETDIMNRVGYDPTPHVGDTWGDPYTAFVGNIDGRQNTTGYGVYWDPIARAGDAWRPSEAFTGWTTSLVAAEVAKGNPVIVWGGIGGYADSWTTPSGKYIDAWKGEHTRTVIGFDGPADNPSRIILNDPYAGRITWTRSQFEANWGIFGNAGVVVR
ncbi:MAG: Ig-like domain-containing protein [Candidatus Kerfeldbacteria bacterium]|nr:Ig-like domain-containing protein [Candidatus Kerfeldbacteria bacterium]